MTDISKEVVERTVVDMELDGLTSTAKLIRTLSARVEELEATRIRMLNQRLSGQWRDEIFEEGRLQGLDEATQAAAKEAERYASHYPEGTDGRNTFTILADSLRGHILEALKEQSND